MQHLRWKALLPHRSRPLVGIVALTLCLIILAFALELIPDAGHLEVYLTNTHNEPIPCVFILPEQQAAWPYWKSPTANTAIGIATNTDGYWNKELPPGTYVLDVALPLRPEDYQVITIYPWTTTRLHLSTLLEQINPQLPDCPHTKE